ncbi:MAG: MerR family transcriptional regulator [Desulfobacteraceae bacterium]|nr:MerR family transcriptional regulator [Desulfobacteraceae bacterium]MDH3719977.1 MerR family transcriptional regulator [Desulfobacteraceae bacterium]MDH3835520.1 MerR family transcriptional regulator [Desulfobacteraceae bacterium]MDH3875426.1 MerR family transcriptional regulator [Desulfobacteraceae bacterium]
MEMEKDLKVSEVARIAGCHIKTVINHEKRGTIKASRDIYNYRRFSIEDAQKLKKILSARWPGNE